MCTSCSATLGPIMTPKPGSYCSLATSWTTGFLACRNGFWRMIGDGSPAGEQDASLAGMQNNAGPYGSEPLSELELAKRRLERLFDV